MLYTLAQMGFEIDIMQYSPELIFEVMEAGAEISKATTGKMKGLKGRRMSEDEIVPATKAFNLEEL